MAEYVPKKVLKNTLPKILNENSINMECAVCLQTCIHPAELPCGHIFCYLCIKGIVNQGRRCAMCRQDIPIDYLDKPRLLKPVDVDNSNPGFDDGHLWFYEGHNGWWQYDERTSLELETAYQKGERCCELLIAGFLYIADFDAMLQCRRNDSSRRRRIKRDLATTIKKGVAGLKPTKQCNVALLSLSDLPPSETRQNIRTPEESVMNNLGSGFSSLSLSDVSSNNSEHVQSEERPRNRSLVLTSSTSHSNSQSSSHNNITTESQTESSASFSSRNLNLNSAMNHSIDWTIEQIESFNLDLLNDYEVLFRDVTNHDSLDRSRSVSVINNSINRNQNSRNRLQDENNLGSTERTQHFSRSEGNVSSANSRTVGNESHSTNNVRNLQSPGSILPAPQVPSRSRGSSQIRSKLMTLHQLPKKNET